MDIPETASRTFRSAVVRVTMIDDSATAISLTSWLIGIKLGAVAFQDSSVTDTISQSGEHQSWSFDSDDLAAYSQ